MSVFQSRRQRAALADLTSPLDEMDLPDGLDIRWLGTAGFALSYEGVTVLVDPYATRLGWRELLRGGPVSSAPVPVDRWIPAADAILVGHTHFDHALDVPDVAARDGCNVFGSASTARLMALHGMAHRAVEVVPHRSYEIGPFRVRFVPSRHAPLAAGRVPMDGELTCDHLGALTPRRYRCGQVWGIDLEVAGIRIYHQGSADLDDEELARGETDLFLCGIAGRGATSHYFERVLTRLRPRLVVVSHFDNFLVPLGDPPTIAPGMHLDRVADEIHSVHPHCRVAALPPPAGARLSAAGATSSDDPRDPLVRGRRPGPSNPRGRRSAPPSS